jgi:hypothetical protein
MKRIRRHLRIIHPGASHVRAPLRNARYPRIEDVDTGVNVGDEIPADQVHVLVATAGERIEFDTWPRPLRAVGSGRKRRVLRGRAKGIVVEVVGEPNRFCLREAGMLPPAPPRPLFERDFFEAGA